VLQGDPGCFMLSRVSRVFHVFQGDPGCSRVLQGGPEWFQVFQAVLRDSWVFQRLSNVFQDVSECSRVIQGVPG